GKILIGCAVLRGRVVQTLWENERANITLSAASPALCAFMSAAFVPIESTGVKAPSLRGLPAVLALASRQASTESRLTLTPIPAGQTLTTDSMTLLALGINHRTAAVDVRERVAFTPAQLDA
ncbi:hypothetical protein R0J93_20785, partial [Pseudoalteromonas sp. SIMBA_148]